MQTDREIVAPVPSKGNDGKAGNHPKSEIVIIVTPHERPSRYWAYVETEREPLCVSRQPFVDSARKLIARGHDPSTVLVMRWTGTKDWALRSRLGVAAELTIDEHNGTVFAEWKPFSRSAVSPRIAKSDHDLSRTRAADKPLLDSTAEKRPHKLPLSHD
jgi:hypothetical protein